MGKVISEETFNQPNAGIVVMNLVREGAELSYGAQFEVFGLPNAAKILLKYVRHREFAKHRRELSDKAQLKVFDLPNAAEILLEYVKRGHKLYYEAELKVFDLPDENAAEIMLEYVKHGNFIYDKAQLKIFALENAAEVLQEYIKHRDFCNKAQLKVFGLPDDKAAEIMLEYVKYDNSLCNDAQKRYDELMTKSAKG